MTSPSDLVTSAQLLAVLSAAEQARLQCEQILNLIESTKSSHPPSSDLAAEEKKLFSHLAQVRGLNRKAVLDVRRTKQETADARQQVDTLHLQLQNLYYEQRHLRGEIALCEGFDHSYKRLPLLPMDKYLALHPEKVGLDGHALMNGRIEYEHDERLALEEARQGLLKRKQTLIAENMRRKELLANLDKKIEDWIDGSEGVEKEFGRCFDELGNVGSTRS